MNIDDVEYRVIPPADPQATAAAPAEPNKPKRARSVNAAIKSAGKAESKVVELKPEPEVEPEREADLASADDVEDGDTGSPYQEHEPGEHEDVI